MKLKASDVPSLSLIWHDPCIRLPRIRRMQHDASKNQAAGAGMNTTNTLSNEALQQTPSARAPWRKQALSTALACLESACLRHGARALGVCCNASFDNVLVVFMPAPAAWFFDASCCIRLIRGSLMHGSCQIADKLGTSLAFNFIAPYSGDLPDEMPLCCRRFYRDYRAKQSTKQRYDAATLQRCCTRWHALHSPPTSLPTRSQA